MGTERKAVIAFVDESGFMLQPLNRRTWAPSGQTPVQYAWDRHDRLSVIAALLYRPRSGRTSLHFSVLDHTHPLARSREMQGRIPPCR